MIINLFENFHKFNSDSKTVKGLQRKLRKETVQQFKPKQLLDHNKLCLSLHCFLLNEGKILKTQGNLNKKYHARRAYTFKNMSLGTDQCHLLAEAYQFQIRGQSTSQVQH